jgi:hypothetical protein
MNARAQPIVSATRAGRQPGRRTGRRRSPSGSASDRGETAKRLGRAAGAGELSLCAAVERLVAAGVDPPASPAERDALLRIALATYVACRREQPIRGEAPGHRIHHGPC